MRGSMRSYGKFWCSWLVGGRGNISDSILGEHKTLFHIITLYNSKYIGGGAHADPGLPASWSLLFLPSTFHLPKYYRFYREGGGDGTL